jgi:hypothetical protein
VFVVDRWEWYRHELSGFKPPKQRRKYRHSLLRRDIRSILQMIMLPLLLRLQIQPRQPAQILLTDRLIHRRPPPNPLPIIIRRIRPPIRLLLHIPQNHILYGAWHPRHLPRNIGLPAPPGLGQVLHNCFGFVGFYALRHHVHDVFHDGCAEFEVEVGLCALFCDGFYEAFGVAALELAGEQVAQPAL